MAEITDKLLTQVVLILILLAVLLSLYAYIQRSAENTNLVQDADERIDIIVSDRVPAGCFIPPGDDGEEIYNAIEKSDLKDQCLKMEDTLLGGEYVGWSEIKAKSAYGIKLDGYCSEKKRATCLTLEEKIIEGDSSDEKRNLEFGYETQTKVGSGVNDKEFVETGKTPQVFVVERGREARLSLYAGVRVGGNRTVQKITGALYKGTVGESELISNLVGEEKSCYTGENFNCYQSSRDAEKCHCSETLRYYEEDPLDLCKNCGLLGGSGSDFSSGCEEGQKRSAYLLCEISGKEECEALTACPNCPDMFKSPEIELDTCKGLSSAKREGCLKYLEFEKNVFQIVSPNYTIVKLGDVQLTDPTFRGTAYASASVTVTEPATALSCYSPERLNDYLQCCNEFCKEGNSRSLECKKPEFACTVPVDPACTGATCPAPETTCQDKLECSTTQALSDENRYVLCKNFCSSQDAYYSEPAESGYPDRKLCTEGCDWAYRMENQYGELSIKNIQAVFIMDTSISMDDEWAELCAAIETLGEEMQDEGYNIKVWVYSLGQDRTCGGLSFFDDATYGTIPGHEESWGPGAAWVMNEANHRWDDVPSQRIIFVVGDEGPYEGGTCAEGRSGTDCVGVINSEEDINSVAVAANMAKEAGRNIRIYGLWGDMDHIPTDGDKQLIEKMFSDISVPTGGSARHFRASQDIKDLLTSSVSRGAAFDKGYNKYTDLSKEENRIEPDTPLLFKRGYEEVYSGLVYIVDWDPSGRADWSYPYVERGETHWDQIKMQKQNLDGTTEAHSKTIGAHIADKIKELYG
ncbi:MAG: hypothetical protein JW727_03960 [Candidatus Aenigmarchaeota archaeon]|nr:hypothetical protein [Candidatus Aenigmarchaeota archaeon]